MTRALAALALAAALAACGQPDPYTPAECDETGAPACAAGDVFVCRTDAGELCRVGITDPRRQICGDGAHCADVGGVAWAELGCLPGDDPAAWPDVCTR